MKVYVRKQQAQDARLAAFAHDLRTPMCCVTGAAQMALVQNRRGADVSEQMEQILLAVRAMDRMLAQLCGEQRAQPVFTQSMLTRELLAMAGEAAREKDQLLCVDLTALGSGAYACDAGSLVRILTNLLLNAVKYTQPGGLIRLCAAEEEGGMFCFTVADNGPGMKPEFLDRLFLPFERAKESAHLPGKGLGLSIVRRLVERMGGTIAVKSEWGKGTEFAVRVPLGAQETKN